MLTVLTTPRAVGRRLHGRLARSGLEPHRHGRPRGALDPADSVRAMVGVLERLNTADSGKFIGWDGQPRVRGDVLGDARFDLRARSAAEREQSREWPRRGFAATGEGQESLVDSVRLRPERRLVVPRRRLNVASQHAPEPIRTSRAVTGASRSSAGIARPEPLPSRSPSRAQPRRT